MKIRPLAALTVLGLGALLAACGGGGGNGTIIARATPTPTPPKSGITLIALGDDAVAAIGSSACGIGTTPCPTTTSAPGTGLSLSSKIVVNGYVQIFARSLALAHSSQTFAFAGLGVRAALTGSAPLAEASASGDFLNNPDQLPSVPGAISSAVSRTNAVVIVVNGGINDVLDAYESALCRTGGGTVGGGGGATFAAPCTASGTTLADAGGNVRNGSLYTAYRAILAAVKTAAPDAAVVLGIPDVGSFPAYAGATAAVRASLTADSQLANAALAAALADVAPPNTLSLSLTDAAGTALFSTPANFADGFHLNDTGYGQLGATLGASFAARFVNF